MLAWQSVSPLWTMLKEDRRGVPSCKDVNFSHLLDSAATNGTSGGSVNGSNVNGNIKVEGASLAPPSHTPSSVIMSPAGNRVSSLSKPFNSQFLGCFENVENEHA